MKAALAAFAVACAVFAEPLILSSPGGNIQLTFQLRGGRPEWSVTLDARDVVLPSAMGLVPEGAPRLDSRFRLLRSTRSAKSTSWHPLYAERSAIPDRFRSLLVELAEEIPPRRTLGVEFRAYDEGVAFRYVLNGPSRVLAIGEEATEFRLPAGSSVWETPRAQSLYRRVPVSEMHGASERPLLVEIAPDLWAAIAEAAVENYPSMFLAPAPKSNAVSSKLTGSARVQTPFRSPWRVVLAGRRPGDLLEHNYLLLNLSPPSRLPETGWIRPGKVLREVTLSTRGGREAVDFAVRHALQFIEFDAGWYGHEYDEESDATGVNVDPRRLRKEPEYQGLDLQAVIRYGKSKNVGVWLYVNRRGLERQIDRLLPLYKSWGVAGVKYGFVNVHTQEWTRWLYGAVAKAASHRLMVDIHDEFRPTGMSRTWPNLMTQEGILGNEGMPDATHSTVLAFTRMLAGAADYTFCWLDPRLKNTWGHRLAASVVFYSPIQFVYWYDRPVAFTGESPGMEWFGKVPTTWDETVVLDGRPGEFAAVARRKGNDWFVGVVTNNEGRKVSLPLSMLNTRSLWTATIYQDGDGARDIRKVVRTLRKADVLELELQPRGGAAVVLSGRPAR